MSGAKYPDGTTPQQWADYYAAVENHKARMAAKKPNRKEYSSHVEFDRAMSRWDMERSCDAPNPPGYYRANND